ncbi:DNA-binding transcriptional LysR family regulator [Janthinobacterium sp. 61]|uniref:LysR family transcriptional regulator n=1 Tax=Janthinobacterium sp. 61 TaxID=2035209 RepID=UPI000C712CEC|nr:LysR family transcriptional regulator [Janthinobacterium sp. 61]PKV42888.1 DNA-binding transcriptional LysR family regulator [Janthinobacterium sp. 61]
MQKQNTDNLSGVALFAQLAQAGSFVAAARQAGISPSAVSKSLARLEQRLGARLFQRSTRQLSLTTEGKLFLARSETILAEMQVAQEELAGNLAPRGRLRLGLPELGGLFLSALAEFSRQHPAIALDLDFSDALADVVGDGFDAVIRIGAPRDSRLAARKLGQFRSCLVASPAYLARHGTPSHPLELQQHACLHYRFRHSGKIEQWQLRQEADAAPLDLPVSMVCNNVDARLHFARQGLGIAWLPDFHARGALAEGSLVEVLKDYAITDHRAHSCWLLWPSGPHLAPKVRALVDFLAEAGILLPAAHGSGA